MYGIMNIFILKDYVVSLPIVFIIIPLMAVYFCILSFRSYYSILLIFLPWIVIKDLMLGYHPDFVFIIFILSLSSWVLLGALILNKVKDKTWRTYFLGF